MSGLRLRVNVSGYDSHLPVGVQVLGHIYAVDDYAESLRNVMLPAVATPPSRPRASM